MQADATKSDGDINPFPLNFLLEPLCLLEVLLANPRYAFSGRFGSFFDPRSKAIGTAESEVVVSASLRSRAAFGSLEYPVMSLSLQMALS